MKIALITDTHWGVRNDNLEFLEYYKKFYENVFFPELEKRNIKVTCHLGDIVDRRKYINYVTLRTMKEVFLSKYSTGDMELHVLIGNHDVPYKNTNDVNSMNELFENSKIHYYSEPKHVTFEGTEILLMPWINNTNYLDALKTIEDSKAQIMFGHFEIAGCLMQRGMISDSGMEISTFKKFDVVASGHFHHKSKTQNVNYLGCPYELTWSDYMDPKGFHIFDTETREFEFIKNPYSMFSKIFYNDEGKTFEQVMDFDFANYGRRHIKVIKQTVNNPYWFDLFMDELYKTDPIHLQVVDDHLNLNLENDEDIVNEAEDTLTILSKYIDTLPESVPKKSLDNLMRSLYNEAIFMENNE